MEDRYLYKAKRLDNGEWVEGSNVKFGIGKCKCGVEFLDKDTAYCGNCGQKLDWEEKDE